MDNTVRKLNIENTDYNFPQGFPIMAGYSSYGSTKVNLTQSFSLPFTTQYFGFSDTFPRYTSTITADEAKTEIKKYRPLFFKWDWYDTESSGSEHIITAELYPVDGNLYSFRAEVPITVHRNGVTTTYIGRIDISLTSNTFTYTYINTITSVVTPNISYEQINVNTTIPAGNSQAVTLSLTGNYTNPPTIFTPMFSGSFTSDISIEYVRLSAFSSAGATVNVQLKNNSSNSQTVQGIIYMPILKR